MTSTYTVPARDLEIVPACEGVWHVTCPGDASLARVADLTWEPVARCWILRLAGGPVREWSEPGRGRALGLPRWLELAVLAQVGAWALLAAAHLRDRNGVLLELLSESATALELHRSDVFESNEQGGRIDDPETAEYLAALDRVIAANRAAKAGEASR